MPLNKVALGLDLYNVRNAFNEKTVAQLMATYGSFENARKAQCEMEAEAIINHFKANAQIYVPGQPPGIID